MAKLRKFVAYRRMERPYTRKSKFRAKAYIKSVPVCKIVRYVMGNPQRNDFQYKLLLRSKVDLQIRDIAIESARQTSNRVLEKIVGKTEYKYIVRVYPHHMLRENPLAAGAGADRMSTGMKMSFGKVIGIAARVFKNQPVFELQCNKNNLATAKIALKKAASKIPCSCRIEVIDNAKKKSVSQAKLVRAKVEEAAA